jgi:hypothetical protein
LFVAASLTPVVLVRFSWIEPLFWPVVPLVLTESVHVADGAPPAALAEVTDGAVPPRLLVTSAKFEFVSPLTGSLNVTVHAKGFAFVGLAPAVVMLETEGAVVSYV